jgi:putative transcriptional regulator
VKQSIEEVILETAKGLYDIGVIDAETMHKFDVEKLTPVREMTPNQIKKLRLREKVSQAVFAKYLNTSVSTVQQWERGVKHPRGISLKVLNLIERNGLDSIA